MRVDDYTGGWQWVYGSYSGAAYDEWYKATAIEADVYFPAEPDYRQVQVVFITNSDAGWMQNELVNWKWVNANESYSAHLVWDISGLKGTAPASSDWFQFGVILGAPGHGANAPYPLDAYIDNVQLTGAPVPEPLTMLTLGGGVLALALRRKRK